MKDLLRQFLQSLIIDDRQIQAWLVYAVDGWAFLIAKSLMKGDKNLRGEKIDAILDEMDETQLRDVSRNLIVGMYRQDAGLHVLLYPEKYQIELEEDIEEQAEKPAE